MPGLGLPPRWATTTCLGLPLRDQISLNGQWAEGGEVPIYFAENQRFEEKTFRRDVTIPADWKDKVVRVEFLAVNHSCIVYMNDRKVAEHIGGWTPFAVQVPADLAKPDNTFSLKVVARLGGAADGGCQWARSLAHWLQPV